MRGSILVGSTVFELETRRRIGAREGDAGRGVLLYFSVDDVAVHFKKAQEMGVELIDEPHENPKARAIEFSLRDPDGYALTISQWAG